MLSEWERFSLGLSQQRRLVEQVVFEFEAVPPMVVFDLAGLMVCGYHLFDSKMFDLRHLHCSQLYFAVAMLVAVATVVAVAKELFYFTSKKFIQRGNRKLPAAAVVVAVEADFSILSHLT